MNFYTPYNQYSLFVMPEMSDDQSSNHSWSPFSTPLISSYGSPPQTNFQYSTSCSSGAAKLSGPIIHKLTTQLPAPIARPFKFNHFKSTQRFPRRSEQIEMKEFIEKSQKNCCSGRSKLCTFCKSNGETKEIYLSHSLKNSVNKIICPILLKYTCVECGASGADTHTIKYCPVMQRKLRNKLLAKITVVRGN